MATDRPLTTAQTQALRYVQDVTATALDRWPQASDEERRDLLASLRLHADQAALLLHADLDGSGR